MPVPSVAVIIPTLNEEANLARLLPSLAAADEVVVSDGGSEDGSERQARAAGALWVEGEAGRGRQLNRGARLTTADVLLFLHADTTLPGGAVDRIRRAVESGYRGGGFLVRFDDSSALFRLGGTLVNARTRLTRVPLGDQAQFVSRDAFEELGGYRDWPILEDLDFARRLKRLGPVALLTPAVVTSARRYHQYGVVRTVANNWWIWLRYFLGASPFDLAERYRSAR